MYKYMEYPFLRSQRSNTQKRKAAHKLYPQILFGSTSNETNEIRQRDEYRNIASSGLQMYDGQSSKRVMWFLDFVTLTGRRVSVLHTSRDVKNIKYGTCNITTGLMD